MKYCETNEKNLTHFVPYAFASERKKIWLNLRVKRLR